MVQGLRGRHRDSGQGLDLAQRLRQESSCGDLRSGHNHVTDIFLGLDWLQLNQVEWNFGRGEIILDGKRH